MNYEIFGDDMQYVDFTLQSGESVLGEPGAMMCKDTGVRMEALFGAGKSQGFFKKLFGAGKRVLTGENMFLTGFENEYDVPQRIAFSAPYPGKVIPLDLSALGGEIICQKDSFLCAAGDIDIGVYFQKKIFTALFGGAGFIMQRLHGDGVVFVNAGGTIKEVTLQPMQKIQADAGCLIGFQPSVGFEIVGAGNLKTQLLGGAGLFLANLTGPGKVWLQSLPFARLASRFLRTPAFQNRIQGARA